MSNELDYIPWYVAKFLVAVAFWPPDRVGAYVLALNWQVEHGGIPARNLTELASILHSSRPKAERLWSEIRHKFVERDGLWWNLKAEETKASAIVKARTNTNRGKAGAAGRWHKPRLSDAQALPTHESSNGSKGKESTSTPQPPAVAGGSRRKRSTRHVVDPYDQQAKTLELKRLKAAGVPHDEALRRAGF